MRADWSKIYRYRQTEKKIAWVSDFKIVIVITIILSFRCSVDMHALTQLITNYRVSTMDHLHYRL
jgi:hypothetical protein